jgi:hypothetical protein
VRAPDGGYREPAGTAADGDAVVTVVAAEPGRPDPKVTNDGAEDLVVEGEVLDIAVDVQVGGPCWESQRDVADASGDGDGDDPDGGREHEGATGRPAVDVDRPDGGGVQAGVERILGRRGAQANSASSAGHLLAIGCWPCARESALAAR